jgi:hypothetical protein
VPPGLPEGHESGRDWPEADALAPKYRLDPGGLRGTLDLVHRGLGRIPKGTPGREWPDLNRIAAAADELWAAIDAAEDRSLGGDRDRLVALVREIRLCVWESQKLLPPPSRRRHTGAVTVQERMAVHALRKFWREQRGGPPPAVSKRKPRDGGEAWRANEAGRFVVEAAAVLGVALTDQRLRSVLDRLDRWPR